MTVTRNKTYTLLKVLNFNVLRMCGLQYLKPPPDYSHIEFPEKVKLRTLEKAPTYTNIKPPKMQKKLDLIRGPELVHNKLVHGQFGVIALRGGRLHHSHLEVIRNHLLKKLDYGRMFAVWRVDAPWQACTKRAVGITLGGGKGNIHHYVTPVKAERVIFEVGGKAEFIEVQQILQTVANKMPFPALAVDVEMLKKRRQRELRAERENMNPFTFEYAIKNNMLGVRRWAKKIDYKYFGKYP